MRHYNILGLDTVLTEGLYSHLVNLQPQLLDRGEVFLPTIDWVGFKNTTGPDSHGWALYLISARALKNEDIFKCELVTIHISPENQRKLAGKVIDLVGRRLQVSDRWKAEGIYDGDDGL